MNIEEQKIIISKYAKGKGCPLISALAMEYFESIERHFVMAELLLVCEQIKRGMKPDLNNYDEFLE